uniref:Uncharacterized protein n=1 Tax=Rhizophora mucronata TaxID=61149 RepID=A0A2P2QKJ8_RHIMU
MVKIMVYQGKKGNEKSREKKRERE